MAPSGWRQTRAAATSETWVSHSAVLLQGEEKERFNAIAEELSQLSTKFSNHVLDGEFLSSPLSGLDVAGTLQHMHWTARHQPMDPT